MAVSSSDVEIRINVIDSSSGEVIADLTNQFNKLGEAGVANGKKLGESLHEAGGGGKEAKEQLHLLSEEVGIHIPRAFRGLVTGSSVARTALMGLGTALTAFGAIQLGVFVFDEVVGKIREMYDEFLNVDKVVREYQEHAREAAAQKLFNDGSIQTQIAMMSDVNREMDELIKKKREASGTGNFLSSLLGGSNFEYFSPEDQKELNELVTKSDAATFAGIEKERKAALTRLQNKEEIAVAGQPDYARPDITRRFDYERAEKSQEFDQRRDQAALNIYNRGELERAKKEHRPTNFKQLPVDAGWQERQEAEQAADVKRDAAKKERQKALQQEMDHLDDQARQASLHGVALLEDQRRAADRDWVTRHGKSVEAVAEIDAKYYADERKLIQQIRTETEQLQGEAAMPLFRGLAATQAQSDLAVSRVRGNGELDEQTKSDRVEAERTRLNNELLNQQRQYTEETDTLVMSSQSRQLQGFARITQEEARQLDERKRKFLDTYGQMDRSKPGAESVYQAGSADYQRGNAAVVGDAEYQRSELARRNAQETSQIEADARARFLTAEKQQTAAIESEYKQRLQKLKEQHDLGLILDDDYNRRVVAAGQQRDAQLVESARQAREKMAGEFSRFFQNPLGTLKEMGNKAAGEAAAALTQRLQSRLGSAGASTPTGSQGGLFGGIFDRMAGMPQAATAKASGTHDIGASKTIALATADIHIQSASIAFGGVTGASGNRSAAMTGIPGSVGGSTSLLSSGGFTSGSGTASPQDYGVGTGSTSSGQGIAAPAGISSAAGDAGAAPQSGGVSGALGNVQQGVGLFKQAKGIFGGGAATSKDAATGGYADTTSSIIPGSFGKNGTFQSGGSTNGGMLGGGGVMNNAAGAAGGAMGLFSAYEGSGGIGGALSGAMSGMQLGMSVGGPIGAAVGAVGGAVLGAIGFGGREKARVYDLKSVRPRITSDFASYQQGSMDYTSAYSDLQALDSEARKTLKQMGSAGNSYYWDTVNGEIKQAEAKLTGEQRAGRSKYTATAAQYDQGGWTGDFGSMATGSDSGWAHMRKNEFVVHEQPAAEHAGALEAIRSGASHSDMAQYYGASSGSSTMPTQTGFGGDVHMHVHTMDTQGVKQFLDKNKHYVRDALNSSLAENSGGADATY